MLTFAGACHSVNTPLGVAERFLQAAHGKGAGARRWLVPTYATISEPDLRQTLRSANLGPAIAIGPERRIAQRSLGPDEPLTLEQINHRYRLTRDPLDAYPRTTAELCLRSFVRAIDSHRAELVAEFIPRRYRSSLDTEALGRATEGSLHVLADLIRHRLEQPLDYVSPDEARLLLDDRRSIRLRRIEGVWIVERFDG